MRPVPIEAGVETLRAAGAQVEVIHPDEALALLDTHSFQAATSIGD